MVNSGGVSSQVRLFSSRHFIAAKRNTSRTRESTMLIVLLLSSRVLQAVTNGARVPSWMFLSGKCPIQGSICLNVIAMSPIVDKCRCSIKNFAAATRKTRSGRIPKRCASLISFNRLIRKCSAFSYSSLPYPVLWRIVHTHRFASRSTRCLHEAGGLAFLRGPFQRSFLGWPPAANRSLGQVRRRVNGSPACMSPMVTKPLVCNSVQLRTIHALSFLADINDSQSRSDLPVEDLPTHAEVARCLTDAENSRQYGVFHFASSRRPKRLRCPSCARAT